MEETKRLVSPGDGGAVEFYQSMIASTPDDDCLIFPGRIPPADIVFCKFRDG